MHTGASHPIYINHRHTSVRGQVAESRWRAIAAAGLRARGEECVAWRGAHMGASIVVELSRKATLTTGPAASGRSSASARGGCSRSGTCKARCKVQRSGRGRLHKRVDIACAYEMMVCRDAGERARLACAASRACDRLHAKKKRYGWRPSCTSRAGSWRRAAWRGRAPSR